MSEQQNAIADKSIDEVLDLIEKGEVTPKEALDIELQGKNRKTLVGALEKMLEPEQPEKIKVEFTKYTLHNTTLYHAGQKVEVSKEDYDILLAANVIRSVEE